MMQQLILILFYIYNTKPKRTFLTLDRECHENLKTK